MKTTDKKYAYFLEALYEKEKVLGSAIVILIQYQYKRFVFI